MRNLGRAFLFVTAGLLGAQNVKFDTPEARVVEVVTSPGQRTAMHEHKLNRVLIYLDSGHQELTDAQGHVEEVRFHAGQVGWSPAGTRHISDNVGNTTYRIVEVELKNGPGSLPASDLDPVRVAPEEYKVEFENPQVRVIRARYGPQQAGPLHEHAVNRVTVYLTDAKVKVTGADGSARVAEAKAGDVRLGVPEKHKEENLGVLPFEVVAVELKR